MHKEGKRIATIVFKTAKGAYQACKTFREKEYALGSEVASIRTFEKIEPLQGEDPEAFRYIALKENPHDSNVSLDPSLQNQAQTTFIGKEYEEATLEKLRTAERERMRNDLLQDGK